MKKNLIILLIFLFSVASAGAITLGKSYFKPSFGAADGKVSASDDPKIFTLIEREVKKGNLRLIAIQSDLEAGMEHHRYAQYFKGLEVFGAQVIKHYRNGNLEGVNGEYYPISELDLIPQLTRDQARELFKADVNREDVMELAEESNLLIYPVKEDDYRLAYKIILEAGPEFSLTGIIDARSGEILAVYSNVHFEGLTIGQGLGYHGEKQKLATTLSNNIYYTYDSKKIRPAIQYTYDYYTFDGTYYYVASDADNKWTHDGALVNAHVYMGLTYDYFYLAHGREGIDDNNLTIKTTVHYGGGTDNAFWSGSGKHMYFFDPGPGQWQFAAALDVVAHEYTHGVTDFTSDLIYAGESGALNEAFSDIMGTAVEHYWQEEGTGLLKAEWYIGEDARLTYTSGIRNLADPNSKGHPAHLSQYLNWPINAQWDWGGVHRNSLIYGHAFYLLAHGGTNNVSGKSVTGIGIEKAAKIFYRAWTYYLFPASTFLNAANALLQSAYGLYGGGSTEYAQTIKAMEAIGWIVY